MEADLITVSTRTAWIGVIASIILPIILCEFVYFNLVAIPAYHSVTWTTTVASQALIQMPTLVFGTFDEGPEFLATTEGQSNNSLCIAAANGPPSKSCESNVRGITSLPNYYGSPASVRIFDFQYPGVEFGGAQQFVDVFVPMQCKMEMPRRKQSSTNTASKCNCADTGSACLWHHGSGLHDALYGYVHSAGMRQSATYRQLF